MRDLACSLIATGLVAFICSAPASSSATPVTPGAAPSSDKTEATVFADFFGVAPTENGALEQALGQLLADHDRTRKRMRYQEKNPGGLVKDRAFLVTAIQALTVDRGGSVLSPAT